MRAAACPTPPRDSQSPSHSNAPQTHHASSQGPAWTQCTSTDSNSGSSESPEVDVDVVSAATPFVPGPISGPGPGSAAPYAGVRIPTIPSNTGLDSALLGGGGSGGGGIAGPVKRYLCQRCLNHGEHWPRKGHKPFCRWASCPCDLCRMVDERRRLNNALTRQGPAGEDDAASAAGHKIRNPMCARCSAHGLQNRLRGHKKRCPFATCDCDLCKLVDERRDLMAKQIKLRRQQKAELTRVSDIVPPPPPPPPPQQLSHHPFQPPNTSIYEACGGGSGMGAVVGGSGGEGVARSLSDLLLQRGRGLTSMEALSGRVEGSMSQSALASLAALDVGRVPLPHLLPPGVARPSGTPLLVPMTLPSAQHHQHPPGHFHSAHSAPSTPLGPTACMGCLETELRHQLRVFELLRLLGGAQSADHLHHHVHGAPGVLPHGPPPLTFGLAPQQTPTIPSPAYSTTLPPPLSAPGSVSQGGSSPPVTPNSAPPQ